MRQEERQERSRQRIFAAAMEEFGAGAYETVTMERICGNYHISKGLMYHYYSNKDELFLLCVEDTFRALKGYIEEHVQEPDSQNIRKTFQNYFMLRERFIGLYPQCRRIFETAVFHPPAHLAEEIDRLHEPIARFNQDYLKNVVAHMPLRQGIRPGSVIRMLESIEFLVRSSGRRGLKFRDADEVKAWLDEILDMALFGVLRQTPDAAGQPANKKEEPKP